MDKIQFYVMSEFKNKYHFIYLHKGNHSNCCADTSIARLLDMTFDEYRTLMRSYGAVRMGEELLFLNKKKAQIFANYLNKKYLVMLKLSGKI